MSQSSLQSDAGWYCNNQRSHLRTNPGPGPPTPQRRQRPSVQRHWCGCSPHFRALAGARGTLALAPQSSSPELSKWSTSPSKRPRSRAGRWRSVARAIAARGSPFIPHANKKKKAKSVQIRVPQRPSVQRHWCGCSPFSGPGRPAGLLPPKCQSRAGHLEHQAPACGAVAVGG